MPSAPQSVCHFAGTSAADQKKPQQPNSAPQEMLLREADTKLRTSERNFHGRTNVTKGSSS
ncbi:hypothetical protein JZ751_008884 [Albula glossodonta]|uniref:Uncharacterized protein n=1 Tax=Albula glossodonta TaxID=121402 RepID=A0A8T2P1Z6_9TELE|nr:hypothetical protein JZ751_008884 [Albula glossodonta]